MRVPRPIAVAGVVLALFATTACGGDDSTDGADPRGGATSPSPSSGCALVSTELVGSTFGTTVRMVNLPSTEPFQDGRQYSCQFSAEPVWSLHVSVRVFTTPQSVDDLVSIGVSRQQFATRVSGVGQGAAYINRSGLIQFVAVEKDADRAKVAVLLGSSGTDDEQRFSTIAREALRNAPN